jgi:hypothetical protein
MDRVSMLLGHNSIRLTEKHHSPWVRARPEPPHAEGRRSWEAPLPARSGSRKTVGDRGLILQLSRQTLRAHRRHAF